jgi:hypothetical protein
LDCPRKRRFFAGALLVLAVGVVFSAAPAAQATGTTVPLTGQTGIMQMLVDPVNHHLIVAGLSGDPTLVLNESDGSSAGTVPPNGGSEGIGMTLSGTTLYVGRCGGGDIDTVDTGALAITSSFTVSVNDPCDLALANDLIWSDNSFGDLRFTTLDPSHVATQAIAVSGFLQGVPGHPTWLVTSNGDEIVVYDVTDPSNPAELAVKHMPPGIQVQDMRVTPDGSNLLVATDAATKAFTELSLPDLSLVTIYKMDGNGRAIVSSPDGTMIAAATDDDTNQMTVDLFHTETPTPVATFDLGPAATAEMQQRALAFSDDGTHLFAGTLDPTGVNLHILPVQVADVTIHATATTITYGRTITLTAHLGSATTNRTLSIYRKSYGSPASLVASGTVDASGNLTANVKPSKNTTYTAVFAGDADFVAPSPTPTVTVGVRVAITTKFAGSYRRTRSGYHLYHFTSLCGTQHRGCPVYDVSTRPSQPRHRFYVTLQLLTRRGWHRVSRAAFTTNRRGKVGLIFIYRSSTEIGRKYRTKVTMAADRTNLASTSRWQKFEITT